MGPSTILTVLLLLTAACGDADEEVRSSDVPGTAAEEPSSDDAARYRGTGMVHEDGDAGPQLCFSSMDSYPPQCGDGVALAGWDWSEATGYESANGVRWGSYEIEGAWDGETLTVERFGAPGDAGAGMPPHDPDRFATSCEEPEGGWASQADPERMDIEDERAMKEYAQSQPEYSASWVDNATDPDFDRDRPNEGGPDPRSVVTNVRFTGDADHHEAAMRELWGGPLCVIEGGVGKAGLDDVRAEAEQMLEWSWSNVDEIAGEVQFGVHVLDPAVQAELDQRFGDGVVVLFASLQPVG